jgi:hypothetical protein
MKFWTIIITYEFYIDETITRYYDSEDEAKSEFQKVISGMSDREVWSVRLESFDFAKRKIEVIENINYDARGV